MISALKTDLNQMRFFPLWANFKSKSRTSSKEYIFNKSLNKASTPASPILDIICTKGSLFVIIVNIQANQYEFVSNNIEYVLGYTSEHFNACSVNVWQELIHPDDVPHLEKLLQQVQDFLLTTHPEQRASYTFNLDYRLRKADGNYKRVLEQNFILETDVKGNSTRLLKLFSDITHWKKENTLTAAVLSAHSQTCFVTTSTHEQPDPHDKLSKRQRDIAKLLAQGYTSKEIAEKLCISIHTVYTHRKHIYRKNNSRKWE